MGAHSNGQGPASIINRDGDSPFVIVCDHASRWVPEPYGGLGLNAAELESHIAWDPGALAVSKALSGRLDAPLVVSNVSRLIIDCNRRLDAHNLIWTLSETTRIAANEDLDAAEREKRIALYYRPYHDAIDAVLDQRQGAGRETILVCVHSFTPVYRGAARPWPLGLIHGGQERFTLALFMALKAADPEMNVGWNEPYAASDGVTFTLEHHGEARGLEATMIEIRNSEILDADGVAAWANRLARGLDEARMARLERPGGG